VISFVPAGVEVLEQRWAPARLVAGPLPAEFGADLVQDGMEVVQLEIVSLEPIELVDVSDLILTPTAPVVETPIGVDELYGAELQVVGGSISLGTSSAGGLVRVGSGTLTVVGTSDFNGDALQLAGGTLRVTSDTPSIPLHLALTEAQAVTPTDFTIAPADFSGGQLTLTDNTLTAGSLGFSGPFGAISVSSATLLTQSPLSGPGGQIILSSHLSSETLLSIARQLSPTDPTVLITAIRDSGADLLAEQQAAIAAEGAP
jgi:hypothetical protein